MSDAWPLVEFLLCASDLSRQGQIFPFSTMTEEYTGPEVEWMFHLAFEARAEALAVAPRVFEYRNDLLADTLLEAAYRVAEGRGVSS